MCRLLLLLALSALPLFSHAIEEPKYEVIRPIDTVELRQCAPYVVAEVVLDATGEDAGNAVPVKMEMTAPVTQAAVSGGMRVQFVLPEGVTLESAPEPLDPRVQLRLVPASQWAAIRYSGTWSQANHDEHLGKLQGGAGCRRRGHAG